MTDTPRGPTTEQLRARVLAHNSVTPFRAWYETNAPGDLVLHGRCLACNREQGERMCDLCQRLEVAEAGAR